MADKLKFDLVAPERLLLSEDVDMVVVPGSEGDFGVMAGHAPVMTTLRPGVIAITGSASDRVFVRGGFAEVTPAGLTVLAEQAIMLKNVDAAALDQHIRDAEEDVADAKTEAAREIAQIVLERLRELRQAL